MNNMSKSMLCFFLIILALYLIGVGVYSLKEWLSAVKERRRNG